MRLIVIGDVQSNDDGTVSGTAWFRYLVPQARQTFYAHHQSGYSSSAPTTGDAGADSAEATAFQNGQYVEVPVSGAKFPDGASITAMLEPSLEGLYASSSAAWLKNDDKRLQFYGSSWDGSKWTVLSA